MRCPKVCSGFVPYPKNSSTILPSRFSLKMQSSIWILLRWPCSAKMVSMAFMTFDFIGTCKESKGAHQ